MTRKLDALIAEKVMGWTRVERAIPDVWRMDESDIDSLITREPTSYGSFKPSEDIAAAWLLIDKIIADDNGIDQVEIGSDCQQDAPDVWYCLFVHGEFGEWPYATAKTPTLAIDLAVLRAVGVPEAEIQEALDE